MLKVYTCLVLKVGIMGGSGHEPNFKKDASFWCIVSRVKNKNVKKYIFYVI